MRNLTLLLISIAIFSCKPSDNQAPIIELLGDSIQLHHFGDPWTDPGFEVKDNRDCDLEKHLELEGSVDVFTAGDYELTYTVEDDEGNISTISRIVRVQFDKADYYSIFYSANDACDSGMFDYVGSIQNCTCPEEEIDILNLGNYGPFTTIPATVSGDFKSELEFDHVQGGVNFIGTGAMANDGSQITFDFTVSDGLTEVVCTSVWIKD